MSKFNTLFELLNSADDNIDAIQSELMNLNIQLLAGLNALCSGVLGQRLLDRLDREEKKH